MEQNQKYMKLALEQAQKSFDPNTKVGCVILDSAGNEVSFGCNNMPMGLNGKFPWDRTGEKLATKYPYVVHAEMKAIISTPFAFRGGTLYVTLFPCNECAKAIATAGIKKVYYLEDKYADSEEVIASKIILNNCGIDYEKVEMK